MNDEEAVPGRGGRERNGRGTRIARAAGEPRPAGADAAHRADGGGRGVPAGGASRRATPNKLLSLALAAGLAATIATGMSGCSTNPHSPDITAPPTSADTTLDAGGASGSSPQAGGPHHPKPNKPGIQLPNTITLAYDRTPTFQDLAHHIVLWNANQALRAQLAASYQRTSAATPDLRRYWSGIGYSQAYNWAQAWIDTKSRPVGRVVVSAVSVDSLTDMSATVSYCQDMSAVIRGDARTYTGGKPLQPPHTDGAHVVMTLVPTGTKGLWQVTSMVVVPRSPLCPPGAEHRSKIA